MERKSSSGLDRRQFLAATGAGTVAATMVGGTAHAWLGLGRRRPPVRLEPRPRRRAKVALVFCHVPRGRPTWPTKDYDYDRRREQLTRKLKAACKNTDFSVSVAHRRDQAEKILKDNPDVDGFVVYLLGIWTGVKDPIMRSGKPVIVVDDLFAGSGEILGPGPTIRKDNLRVALVATSDLDEVVRAVRWLEVIAALKGARIVNVKDRDISGQVKLLRDVLGTDMVQVKSDEFNRFYKAADQRLAEQWTNYWIKRASGMNKKETSRREVVKAARTHIAICNILKDKDADTVTMDCLTLVYGKKVEGYPCLSFFELLNQGLTGVCESDVDSTATFLLMRYLTGRPGFVSDPVIDTSTGEIIYAHCLGTNRVFGPRGMANKYIIRSHAEDNAGASVQSLMPTGQPITSLKIHLGTRHLVVHTGTTTRNIDEPKACRTKLAAKAEVENLLQNWTRGWHRVTVYGQWRKDVVNLGRLLGLTVIEEDKPMAV